jgi:two-component system, cell cycle sensor histidine kinase and response regulator CckA
VSEALPPALGQRATAGAPPSWLSWRGSGRILVIDDDDSVRAVVARSLARLGFTVDQASDGLQAISKFRSDPTRYALVILDFKLPGMDGSEVASRLRDIKPDVRLILVSGVSRQEALDEFTGQDATGFLQKPFALSGLVSELRAVLEA